MPWTTADVDDFNSGLTDEQKQQWVAVANDALQRCIDDGGTEDECDASAIQQANGVISRMRDGEEAQMELGAVARIDLGSAGKYTLNELVEAVTIKATAKGLLRQLTAVLDMRDVPDSLRKEIEDVVNALKRTWADLSGDAEAERGHENPLDRTEEAEEMYDEMPMAMSPGGATSFDALDAEAEARAYAERAEHLTAQFQTLMANVLWAAEDRIPDKASAMRDLVSEFIDRLGLEPSATQEAVLAAMGDLAELAEADIREDRGHVSGLVEANSDGSGPLRMRVVLIEPGMGNSKDNHLYEADMLKRDAHVFEGVKMYATDHRKDETNVRYEVSQILRCPVEFTSSGAPVAEVGVFDPAFAQNIRNREALGVLDGLHCSIRAKGKVKRGVEFGGQTVNRVEAILAAESVDWVSQAGAGGRALALVESAEGTEANDMADETENTKQTEGAEDPAEEAQVVEATLIEADAPGEDAQEETVELSMRETLAILLRADLPDPAKARIAERAPFTSQDALLAEIESERTYLTEVASQPARSGPRVVGMGRTRREPVQETQAQSEVGDGDIIRAHLGR